MTDIRCFIKNHEKDGKIYQVLTVCVSSANEKIYKDYFVNVSTQKGTVYLAECKKGNK